ncbi:MAG: cytidylate kinase family protein [Rubrivivax sp.]|nr:cytidylate kinase family protein [Rubrivivax sp.]MDP3611850.1 cytidylate kinase family protein [Rubrivivax sp.]
MPVIALTQGMGSLAQDVAEQLAEELQLSTLQHEVAERVAEKMHVSRSLINRLRGGKAGTIEKLRSDRHAMALYSAEEVLEAAAKGNVVIRGWGATQLLRSVPHIPCIRIMRPFDKRVQWLMDEIDTDDRSVAEAEIRRSDEANASRMQDQFGVTWNEPVLFDAVLNTDRLSVDSCVQTIRTLLTRPEFAETEESRSLLQGLALSAHVRSALRASEHTHGVDIVIESRDGRVTLRGIVASVEEKAAAQQVSTAVAGVKAVDDQLRVMSRSKLFPSNRQ